MKTFALVTAFVTLLFSLTSCAGVGPQNLVIRYSLTGQDASAQQMAALKAGIWTLAGKHGMQLVPQGSDPAAFMFLGKDDDGQGLNLWINTGTGRIGVVRNRAANETQTMRILCDEVEALLRTVVGEHSYEVERLLIGPSLFH